MRIALPIPLHTELRRVHTYEILLSTYLPPAFFVISMVLPCIAAPDRFSRIALAIFNVTAVMFNFFQYLTLTPTNHKNPNAIYLYGWLLHNSMITMLILSWLCSYRNYTTPAPKGLANVTTSTNLIKKKHSLIKIRYVMLWLWYFFAGAVVRNLWRFLLCLKINRSIGHLLTKT